MLWNLDEALQYYQRQGAPSNQLMLVNLLKEIQQESGGGIPRQALGAIERSYGVKEAFLLAVIKRIPSLRVQNTHCLEICGDKSCIKQARLTSFIEKTYGRAPENFTVKSVGCMRQCNQGPNIRWDGELYHRADETLIRRLVETASKG